MSIGDAPPKFIKDNNGVRRINPLWSQWKKQQDGAAFGGAAPVPTAKNAATALPIITSRADQQANMPDAKISDAVTASEEMLQDEDIAAEIGVADPMAEIRVLFSKWEVPLGLLNKLMVLSDFQYGEMIVDDSGSMNAATDVKDQTGRFMTRWQEVYQRISQMFEIMAFVPAPPIYVRFLNRQDVVECKKADGEAPQQYLQRALTALAQQWQRPPAGTTPMRERIAESLGRCQGQSMIRWIFGDGAPNGGAMAANAITQMVCTRRDPQQNPIFFMSCTNEDDQVAWMKEAEEAAPFCAEYDDFGDESDEVIGDQGAGFPFSYGAYLVGCICGAMDPDVLDALDESVPFTAATMSNYLGYDVSQQDYGFYFQQFLEAQRRKPVETTMDKVKKDHINIWHQNYQHFLQAPVSKQIPCVQNYHQVLHQVKMSGR